MLLLHPGASLYQEIGNIQGVAQPALLFFFSLIMLHDFATLPGELHLNFERAKKRGSEKKERVERLLEST
jgi:hypothetical protein